MVDLLVVKSIREQAVVNQPGNARDVLQSLSRGRLALSLQCVEQIRDRDVYLVQLVVPIFGLMRHIIVRTASARILSLSLLQIVLDLV